jgi:hypothetical protein
MFHKIEKKNVLKRLDIFQIVIPFKRNIYAEST